ncbi:uncharacterized protein MKK02DRAFT_40307 [Dioszegia hungarica]|uniref:Copper acquisition factor BIM1-like domain-containing protein n=1 Tax=Dioszegia hungarica TaxID=4972 RepID=A0AA38H2V9_9TREE|nr:uncharacterized protein MKK02DRAFT_40307 [Dioszegia hungarica]KAI9632932.1 hypothetical protein MKK02DRAFT_40307 [Dioszegia hungarica]
MLFAIGLVVLAVPFVLAQSGGFTQAVSKLSYPPSRGSDPLVSSIGPCQAYALGGRVPYPLSGGRISWSNIRDLKAVQIAYSTSSDPSAQSDFIGVGQNLSISYVGTQCVAGPDFAGLGMKVGDEVTVQLGWQAGPRSSPGFECADLTLVSNDEYAAGNWTVPCTNTILTTQIRGGANPQLAALKEAEAASNSNSNSTSTSGGGSGLTVTEAGVVGAMVSLVTVLLALGVLALAGVVGFGKRAKRARAGAGRDHVVRDDMTEKSVGSA